MAGRLPKPTALKQAEGNPGKRPLSTKREPEFDALSDLQAPDWLIPEAKAAWGELAPSYAKIRLLTRGNAHMFAAGCQELGHYIAIQSQLKIQAAANDGKTPYTVAGKNGVAIVNQLALAAAMHLKAATKIWREFGGTPVGLRQLAMDVQTSIFDLPGMADHGEKKPASSYYN